MEARVFSPSRKIPLGSDDPNLHRQGPAILSIVVDPTEGTTRHRRSGRGSPGRLPHEPDLHILRRAQAPNRLPHAQGEELRETWVLSPQSHLHQNAVARHPHVTA